MSGGFNNPIVGGGGALVYPSIHSPNFVAGVSGWTINKDGSAEFDNLTIRGTFNGFDFIINASGEFYYSGTPAAGNLVMSSARVSGTDAFGNAWLAGFTTYVNNAPSFLNYTATNLFNGNISVYSAATEAGPWTLIDDIHVGQNSSLGPSHFISIGNGTGSAVVIRDQVFGAIVAADPANFSAKETWHTITLDAGWSAVAGYAAPSYRLLPDGCLQLTGAASHAAFTTGTNLNSGALLPAAYRPTTTKTYRGNAAGGRAGAQVDNTGLVTAQPGGVSSTVLELDGILPLNL